MEKYIILADITCDLSEEMREYFGITDYFPGHINLGNGREEITKFEWDFMSSKEFYKALSDKNQKITTAPPNVEEYYQKLCKKFPEISFNTGGSEMPCSSGKVVVNGKDVKDYFVTPEQVQVVNQPLLVTSMGTKYDILINVTGGGLNGQAAACLHGISRALVQIDPDARTSLKANGYLTRDSRMVERKKYGQRGARRRFQFSKR